MWVLADRLNTQETRPTDIPTTESNILQRYIDICLGLDVIYLSVNLADQIFKADEGACGKSRDAAARLCALATSCIDISSYRPASSEDTDTKIRDAVSDASRDSERGALSIR